MTPITEAVYEEDRLRYRSRFIRSRTAETFEQFLNEGFAALSLFIADGIEPHHATRPWLRQNGQFEYEHVEGGKFLRKPHNGKRYNKRYLTFEPAGWTVLFCKACEGEIDLGHSYWLSKDNPCVICTDCHAEITALYALDRVAPQS